jgi:hypothetical protein
MRERVIHEKADVLTKALSTLLFSVSLLSGTGTANCFLKRLRHRADQIYSPTVSQLYNKLTERFTERMIFIHINFWTKYDTTNESQHITVPDQKAKLSSSKVLTTKKVF